MAQLFTPKQVARAIQVSESSVKRWCDQGVIPTQYTAGGHRRIEMSGLLEFLKTSKHRLVRPEVVGLPATSGRTGWVLERGAARLTDALIRGDEEGARQILLDLYLAGHHVCVLGDEVLAKVFEQIGDLWQCGSAEVYQERRACEIAMHLIHELRTLLKPSSTAAPLAIGGAPAGDPYNLATLMVELVLRDDGWRAVNLGDDLPITTLAAAIREQQPKLFWLSCSHLEDEQEFLQGYGELYREFGDSVAFVVGGRSLTEGIRRRMKYAAFCDNLQHLRSFACSLRVGDGVE